MSKFDPSNDENASRKNNPVTGSKPGLGKEDSPFPCILNSTSGKRKFNYSSSINLNLTASSYESLLDEDCYSDIDID